MTNKKLVMFAVAGVITPAAYSGTANAESQNTVVSVAVPAPVKDTAPTTGNPPRLRRTDQEQPGNEMPAFALFTDATGKQTSGLYFAMTTELSGARAATNKIQLSATPFKLTQDATTGAVSAVADFAAAKFVTNNNGNERRNANAPTATTINGGTVVLAKYNYQPNGTNDTVTYFQAFNAAGAVVLPQTKAYAKNNDDCSMHQDGAPGVAITTAPGVTKLVEWAGCNGNGRDDGWAFVTQVTCDSATAPTSCKFANVYDISLAQQEERSRGSCTVTAADTSFAVCSWTEGNNQPQRQGVWLAAISLDASIKGSDQANALLWKQQIAGRIDNNPLAPNAKGVAQRTYAQRAIQERIMVPNATTGALEASDKIIYRYGDAVGRNNNKGTYFTNMISVIQVTKAGPTFMLKPTDMTSQLSGLGGTHLGSVPAVFGADATPGLVFLAGSLNGGGLSSMLRSVSINPTTYALTDLGAQGGPAHDMHLYPNYLGNNPGNQGRNHSDQKLVPNPFVNIAGSTSKFLLLSATTAKTTATTCAGCIDTMSNPAIKLTALMSVMPMGSAKATSGSGAGTGGGTGQGSAGTDGTPTDGSTTSDPGTTLGGCSAGGASNGLATFLLIGFAAFIRRRR